MKSETIKVFAMRCSEDKVYKGRIEEIENTLEAKQKFVGGYIEVVNLTDEIDLVLNDEGKLNGLPFNRVWKDKDNKILGSEEQTLMILYPGQECVCAAVLIEVGEKPHRIDITALDPEEYFISSVTMLEHPAHEPMVGQNITVRNESVTGEIFNPNDYKVGSAMVTVIFRDDSGKIVYSAMTFINQIPANGSTPFEVNYYTDIKLPSNCEVYAYLW